MAIKIGGVTVIDDSKNFTVGGTLSANSSVGTSGQVLQSTGTGVAWASQSSNVTGQGLYEHSKTISANYAISAGNNAVSTGPLTINAGVSVTVPTNSRWVVL